MCIVDSEHSLSCPARYVSSSHHQYIGAVISAQTIMPLITFACSSPLLIRVCISARSFSSMYIFVLLSHKQDASKRLLSGILYVSIFYLISLPKGSLNAFNAPAKPAISSVLILIIFIFPFKTIRSWLFPVYTSNYVSANIFTYMFTERCCRVPFSYELTVFTIL